MANVDVIVRTESAPGGATQPLADAWVYWKEGGAITVLRTDAEGYLHKLRSGGIATRPWDYTDKFKAAGGTQVEAHYSRGALPTPVPRLDERADAFVQRTIAEVEVNLPTSHGTLEFQIAAWLVNTLNLLNFGLLLLPLARVELARPGELVIWPLLWEPIEDAYLTAGLNQGAALWAASNLTVTENAAAPALGEAHANLRPRERGLRLEGSIDARATAARIQILGADGNAVSLRQSATATAAVNDIAAVLGEPSGETRPWSADVYLANAGNALGLVQILVRSSAGVTPAILATFACQLTGIQIALACDHQAGDARDGERGAVPTAQHERIIVDFLVSPQQAGPVGNVPVNLTPQARARRMVPYDLFNRARALSDEDDTQILKPEMPLWMAEMHLVGLTRSGLEDLLLRRGRRSPPLPRSLSIVPSFALDLSWDGPNAGPLGTRRYSYRASFEGDFTVTLRLNEDDELTGAADGERVTGAISPAPVRIAFPIEERRLPEVLVSNGTRGSTATRRWGRAADGVARATTVIEWQPAIVDDDDREILRGGDGKLSLELTVDGARVHPGIRATAEPREVPDAALPAFRIRGTNAGLDTHLDGIIDALVQEYHDAHSGDGSVQVLSLACWQETMRRIFHHEARNSQFDGRGTARRRYLTLCYGCEGDMPIFGPPAGYGLGQLDNPAVNDDQVWSFVENMREAIRRLMVDKANAAYNALSGDFSNPRTRRDRAVYQREIVRRYNGGTEFRRNAGDTDWEIRPSLAQWTNAGTPNQAPNPNLNYPNQVLGTSIVYWTGAGATAVFPWPIAFPAAQYGPET